jgi:small subunit ribosomal protein S20|uniref:Small ribosomal subunit protein bS20c n=1 Tax=Vaucheria litorea TaxID=109269 RepID=B7T1S7_VAULI|nr:ribosomal protein S20 [Vaucheria litorea]ACF70893.1 ribosomal protein S20 [Vaucheria litorea]
MANNNSAIKRIKTSERKRKENLPYKSLVKTYIKKYFKTLEDLKIAPTKNNYINAKIALNLVFSKIDKAKKKNIFHKNSAARKKSKLMKALFK